MEFYAHSIDGKPVDEWHRLEEHLKSTAELSASFAEEFGCGEWGRIAGCGMTWEVIGMDKLYAHSRNKAGIKHHLSDHLSSVSRIAGEFPCLYTFSK